MQRIDEIIAQGGFEEAFTKLAMSQRERDWTRVSSAAQDRFARFSVLALRCNIVRKLIGVSFRELSVRAADSSLLQWFLRIGEVDRVKSPSKSTLERLSKWVGLEALEELCSRIVKLSCQAQAPEQAQPLALIQALDCSEAFLDTTCLKANIHFPVDWVLLRDAARTLMKATLVIRTQGLKARMPQEPLEFLSQMNKLCIAMSANRRRPQAKKARKKVLRRMKALANKIAGHARAHRDLLLEHQQSQEEHGGLSKAQGRVIIKRIEGVLEQLPAAIWQAHERIIGERQVPNAKKILSLYEPEAGVVVRGKAGAEVEFGNKLWLAESRAGLILDWKLLKDGVSDARLLKPGIERLLEQEQALHPAKVWGDRGIFSAANVDYLQQKGIQSGLCPRNPRELERRLDEEEGFGEGLRRRGGIEARIAIFKNVFIGSPGKAKGFAHQEIEVGWAALAHNLWVAARQPRRLSKPQKGPVPHRDEMLERARGLPDRGAPEKKAA